MELIAVTVIGGVFSVLVAFITKPSRATKKHTEETVVLLRGNGSGDVPTMLKKLLDGQARHEADDVLRFDRIDSRLKRVEQSR